MNRYPFRPCLLTKSALHNGCDTRFPLRNDDVIPPVVHHPHEAEELVTWCCR